MYLPCRWGFTRRSLTVTWFWLRSLLLMLWWWVDSVRVTSVVLVRSGVKITRRALTIVTSGIGTIFLLLSCRLVGEHRTVNGSDLTTITYRLRSAIASLTAHQLGYSTTMSQLELWITDCGHQEWTITSSHGKDTFLWREGAVIWPEFVFDVCVWMGEQYY